MRPLELDVSEYPLFTRKVKTERRHILDDEQLKFLESVYVSIETRTLYLPSNSLLWRARRGHNGYRKVRWTQHQYLEIELPLAIEDMKPRPDRSAEGRVNPKGIPCLYCSTDRDTAMSELRPWVGERLTVAELMTLRSLRRLHQGL
jgi:hypothetical protein